MLNSLQREEENMSIKIALAGNPNCGKTTLFNILTGSNQYVGNWPGVTVEKKEGKLKGHGDVVIQDLPGIYSLSPYSPEEVVTRGYLVDEHPDAILNIIDGTNIERNLYLTTQLLDLGHPVVVAVNMIDLVRKNGDRIDLAKLSRAIGCPCIEISALKGEGLLEAAERAVELAKSHSHGDRPHVFGGGVEHALAHIEDKYLVATTHCCRLHNQSAGLWNGHKEASDIWVSHGHGAACDNLLTEARNYRAVAAQHITESGSYNLGLAHYATLSNCCAQRLNIYLGKALGAAHNIGRIDSLVG